MASKRLNAADDWTGRRINFAAFAKELSYRRAELGQPELPRNSGQRRTESKRGLLKAIKDAGGEW